MLKSFNENYQNEKAEQFDSKISQNSKHTSELKYSYSQKDHISVKCTRTFVIHKNTLQRPHKLVSEMEYTEKWIFVNQRLK